MGFRQIKSLNKFIKKRFFNSEKGMPHLNVGVILMGTSSTLLTVPPLQVFFTLPGGFGICRGLVCLPPYLNVTLT